ncbi:MAG: hypothetical protein ABI629_12005 [bacterium]
MTAVVVVLLAAGAVRAEDDLLQAAKLIQQADIQPEDLPLDAEGRSARDGRQITGVVARDEAPSAVVDAQEALVAERAAIADGQIADDAAVRVEPASGDLPARVDSGDRDPDRQVTELPLPTGR